MTNFIAWITTSSADPEKMALTVKGFLVFIVPVVAMLFGIDNELANSLIGPLVDATTTIMTLIGLGMTIYGIGRKIILGRLVHPDA